MDTSYITGQIQTNNGNIPQVSDQWSGKDTWGTIKARWSVGRMDYSVAPGLYALGAPDENSRVFVSANYKLSFDHLRRSLSGMNAWILVLNTFGINVWCAAGKGTFGTGELVRQINSTHLEKIVSHRKLIVPQLGATGVAAHEVRKQTGFTVIYGPVRASDIKPFMDAGLKATEQMRRVYFPFWDRMKLVPVELSYGKYYLLIIPALFFLLSGFYSDGFSVGKVYHDGGRSVINLLAGYLSGVMLTPLLLPWIPLKRFFLKGLVIGWLVTLILLFTGLTGKNILEIISWFFMTGGLSSFLAMNFTGSSTYTSLSGVQKEMKTAIPFQIVMTGTGFILWILSKFIML